MIGIATFNGFEEQASDNGCLSLVYSIDRLAREFKLGCTLFLENKSMRLMSRTNLTIKRPQNIVFFSYKRGALMHGDTVRK